MQKLSEMVSQNNFEIVQGEIDVALEDVRRSQRMIWKLWDRYFATTEKKTLYEYDQEDISDTLYVIDDILFGYIRNMETFIGTIAETAK